MTGAGNDFVVIDDRENRIGADARELAKQLCRRRFSVGADGLILVVAFEKAIAARSMTFESSSGLHEAMVLDGGDVRLNMADPRAIMLRNPLLLAGVNRELHRINTGVPHAVCEVDDIDSFPVVEVGRIVRYHSDFMPEGTNADFMQVLNESTLSLRTYERGVEDETLACGTGAVAAALVSAALGKTKPPVSVVTRGGDTLVIGFYMSELGFCDVTLEGNADIVFEGALDQSES